MTKNQKILLNPKFESTFNLKPILARWWSHLCQSLAQSLLLSILPPSTNSCSWDQVEEWLMGYQHHQKAVSCATATLSAKLPWELSLAEWRDLFHFTADRSTLPGRPLPVSLIHQLCSASWRLLQHINMVWTPISPQTFPLDSPLCSLSIWLCPH